MTLTDDHDAWVHEVFGLDMSSNASAGAGAGAAAPAAGGRGGRRSRRRHSRPEPATSPDEILVMWTESLT